MSGTASCATTDPSTNSTIEWTMDWGCIRTFILSALSSKSQRASIISSALFIMVALSMVTFLPMCQVGCARAWSGVTSRSSSSLMP